MNNEEILSLIEQLKGQGLSEEEIMDTYYETFKKGEMDRKDLETLAEALGYELTDDFKEDEHADPIATDADADAEGITKEEAEDLKEIKPGESKEEFKEKVDEVKDEDEGDADDDERKEAMKLFDLD